MLVFKGNSALQKNLANDRLETKSIGFVPTMGALHDGHLTLVKTALQSCDRVVASIFVNPRQFNNANDLARYPRTIEKDISLLEGVGCHYLYAPEEAEVYDSETTHEWRFGNVMSVMEGEFRPKHFEGMLSVVHQLLTIIKPHRLFMGEKDFQQAALVRRLLTEHHPDIHFHLVDTVREPDGLAMSSRNVLLSPDERVLARFIASALQKLTALTDITACIKAIAGVKEGLIASGIQVDYLDLRREEDLSEVVSRLDSGRCRVFFAGHVGKVRLIDNMYIPFSESQ
jgi:pantoate--beta-alanine ligase